MVVAWLEVQSPLETNFYRLCCAIVWRPNMFGLDCLGAWHSHFEFSFQGSRLKTTNKSLCGRGDDCDQLPACGMVNECCESGRGFNQLMPGSLL